MWRRAELINVGVYPCNPLSGQNYTLSSLFSNHRAVLYCVHALSQHMSLPRMTHCHAMAQLTSKQRRSTQTKASIHSGTAYTQLQRDRCMEESNFGLPRIIHTHADHIYTVAIDRSLSTLARDRDPIAHAHIHVR